MPLDNESKYISDFVVYRCAPSPKVTLTVYFRTKSATDQPCPPYAIACDKIKQKGSIPPPPQYCTDALRHETQSIHPS